MLLLVFLLFPFGGKRTLLSWLVDGLFMAGAAYANGYLLLDLDGIIARAGLFAMREIWAGIVGVVVLREASRRVIGLSITLIGLALIVYTMAGPRGNLPWLGEWLPGIPAHRGYDSRRLIGQLFLGQGGLFGLPLGVAATVVSTFVLFGVFYR